MDRYEFNLEALIHELMLLFNLQMGQNHGGVHIGELLMPIHRFYDRIIARRAFRGPCISMCHRK